MPRCPSSSAVSALHHRIREELAEVRARENQLLADLEEARREDASPAAQQRQRRLEEETRVLAQRRGELVHHRPALKTPVTVMLTATGILAAFVVGVLGIAQASAQGPSAVPGVTESPSGR